MKQVAVETLIHRQVVHETTACGCQQSVIHTRHLLGLRPRFSADQTRHVGTQNGFSVLSGYLNHAPAIYRPDFSKRATPYASTGISHVYRIAHTFAKVFILWDIH
ncbi:rh133 [macacine betaherpesvirus 3]|uniref:Rh133 n=1 Tax=Rhesus cytomegalovirus (strain 68-1) TaxID=47929 RepID=Q7TFK7_RHCM6|nr:rh133 [macacine betaherpesvirus 3]AAP50657.1 rh133 [macacine betaherpesvirus 3]AAZ80639.1 rh133 [macacine betaherpesvirus 3]